MFLRFRLRCFFTLTLRTLSARHFKLFLLRNFFISLENCVRFRIILAPFFLFPRRTSFTLTRARRSRTSTREPSPTKPRVRLKRDAVLDRRVPPTALSPCSISISTSPPSSTSASSSISTLDKTTKEQRPTHSVSFCPSSNGVTFPKSSSSIISSSSPASISYSNKRRTWSSITVSSKTSSSSSPDPSSTSASTISSSSSPLLSERK
mmetsp:Transcript_37490/g.82077  ORF Transcript_37490/g.82077 Transcript_37490/m.82077 type:complete len:207 (+) Transcript_37490:974-1594(+)